MTNDRPQYDGRGFSDLTRSSADALIAYLDGLMSAPESAERYRIKYELLDLQAGESVLDLGCGAGADLFRIAQSVGATGRAVGLDLNPAMIEAVRERAAGAGLVGVEADLAPDNGTLPFADGSFDVVHTERVLIHVADPDQTLREIMRVLKPGGRVVCCETDFGHRVIDFDDIELLERLEGPGWGPPNRYMGRQLFRRFIRTGFADVLVSVVPNVYAGSYSPAASEVQQRQSDSALRQAIHDQRLSIAEADRLRGMRQARLDAGEFFSTTLLMVARGVKPA